jgi:hypothetical protein
MQKLLSAIIFFLFATTAFGQGNSAVSSEEAASYQKNTVIPLLDKILDDQTYPLGIRKRISLLRLGIENKQIAYYAEPFYSPDNKEMVMSVEWDEIQDKPALRLFIPAAKDLQSTKFSRSPENFELLMAIYFAHEYVHIERDQYHHAGVTDRDEAEAWGITILEMIRPALKQKRSLPESLRYNSEQLKRVKDNYDDPRWIQAFTHYAKK